MIGCTSGSVIPLPPVFARVVEKSEDCRAEALAKADSLNLATSTQRAKTRQPTAALAITSPTNELINCLRLRSGEDLLEARVASEGVPFPAQTQVGQRNVGR